MSHAQAMLDTHPRSGANTNVLADALQALEECVQTCSMCADACLAEDMVAELRRCIRLNLDCAELCATTAAILGRQTEGDPSVIRATLEACLAACEACGAECSTHADMHEHCRVCAEACKRCAEACRSALSSLS